MGRISSSCHSNIVQSYMDIALKNAQHCTVDVPVGAIILSPEDVIIAHTHNRVYISHNPCAHAEILALESAAKAIGSSRLDGCTMYVTLEPCPMCASAIAHARIHTLYYGAYDIKGGGVDNGPRIYDYSLHKPIVYGGIRAEESARLLQQFFIKKRKKLNSIP